MTNSLIDTLFRAYEIHEYELPKYHSSLGKFISTFSDVEYVIQKLLWRKTGVTDTIGKAVFSGCKIDLAISHIRRIHSHEDDLEPELEKAFSQLSAINNLRNHVVHYGADFGPETPVSTNKKTALKEDKIKEYPVSCEILSNATEDIQSIRYLINTFINEFIEFEDYPAEHRKEFLQRTFLYKSPSQGSNGHSSLKNAQTQSRPPQS